MQDKDIFSAGNNKCKKQWHAPVLPVSKEEMKKLGWESCDIIIVTGDAYVDHPSFGMAIIGRVLEAQGFRVGIISQPDWQNKNDFMLLGRPNLMFGVTAGNMDSMVNRYTANLRIRSDDAYTADDLPGKRPDRSVIVYAQRCREAFSDVPIVIGGIESGLRRFAHYDYWSDKVRRSILFDSKADLLVYGNGERQMVEISRQLADGANINEITDLYGTGIISKKTPAGWLELDCTDTEKAKTNIEECINVNSTDSTNSGFDGSSSDHIQTVVRVPSYEQVSNIPVLFALAARLQRIEGNSVTSRPIVQSHGQRDVWINPPAIPLTTKELDRVYELPFTRKPHPCYGKKRVPAYEMIRFSITITRGCFGGCSFCSITSHEGKIIQNRSEDSVIREIKTIRDTVPGFTGTISDLGGPTANMYRMNCKNSGKQSVCRKLSCIYPDICPNLNTDHSPLIHLYRNCRSIPGIKKVLIGSGIRYDLAVQSPDYVKELAYNHVGGYLKIAPEHTEKNPLCKMLKPDITSFNTFRTMFETYSKQAGKKQYLIPYFIAAHPGTTLEDMLKLALWLKKNNFKLDQVQTFLPSPMTMSTAMYFSGKNPLRKVTFDSEEVVVPRGLRIRRIHKAFLRYYDPSNWPLLRKTLKEMGRQDLVGSGNEQLIPSA